MLAQLEKIEDRISSLKSDLLRGAKAPDSTGLGNINLAQSTDEWAARIQDRAIPAILAGDHVVEVATGATIFLGKRSDPALVLGCRPRPEQIGSPIELDMSSPDQLAPKTYPFSSLWAPDASLSEIARALPDDSDIIRFGRLPYGFVQEHVSS